MPFTHELIGIAFATIRRYFLSDTAVMTKSDASPVTLADREAEAAMRALIELRYPEHGVVGEEHGVKPGTGGIAGCSIRSTARGRSSAIASYSAH